MCDQLKDEFHSRVLYLNIFRPDTSLVLHFTNMTMCSHGQKDWTKDKSETVKLKQKAWRADDYQHYQHQQILVTSKSFQKLLLM